MNDTTTRMTVRISKGGRNGKQFKVELRSPLGGNVLSNFTRSDLETAREDARDHFGTEIEIEERL